METNQNAVPEAAVSPTPNPPSAATIPTTLGNSQGVTTSTAPEVAGDHANGVLATTTITNPIVGGTAPAAPAQQLDDATTDAFVQQVLSLMNAVSPYALAAPTDKLHSQKPRPGMETMVPVMVKLAQAKNISFDGVSCDQLLSDAATAEEMSKLAVPVGELNTLIANTLYALRLGFLGPMQDLYAVLLRLAIKDPALAEQMVQVRKVFATTHAKPKTTKGAAEPATTSTSTSATPAPSATVETTAAPEVTREKTERHWVDGHLVDRRLQPRTGGVRAH